jgi:hypothetical protein
MATAARKTKTKVTRNTKQSGRGTAAASTTATSRADATRNGRSRAAGKTTVARADAAAAKTAAAATVTCPECGRTFTRAAALGAHRRQAHGVIGSSASSRASGTRRGNTTPTTAAATVEQSRTGAVDHDVLLKALFPNGIPPNERTIRSVNNWLGEADRLARS